ncbi:hypothetical protein GCM10028778_16840 [Barrientosiimonas marina]|uniref:MerR family transcriptional regulator n=1 Tax=Lentibacillus kimchii TaxID=1542911 RepID=A0ABW2UXG3_9BACI
MDLLRKKDLHPEVGVAKSTVADWIEDFNIYIPKTKQKNVTYYRPEAIEVLNFIKQCRERNYQKQQIMELLADQGFPVMAEAQEDAEESISKRTNQDNGDLRDVIQTMGQAVQKLSDQDESIKSLQDREESREERMDDMEKRTEQTSETVEDLKQEIQDLKTELAETREKVDKRGFWARLFKRNSNK